MKQLSIEDKAKRYDDAIEFAYNKHRFSSNLSEIKIIEELFPELQESEDSRIINNIKKAVESYWSDEPLQEILDWLEKQGGKGTNGNEREITFSEQKSAEEYNITGIGSKNAQGKLGEMIKRKLEIEKHCEQKPAIKLERDDNGEAVLTPFEAELFSMMSEAWQGYSFGEEVNIAKIVKEHSKELLERANEQMSAWNEEDEYCLAGAIETELYMLDVVNGVKKFDVGNSSIKEECTRELDWLKSLKERVQPQPKQEWSEEDEINLEKAIWYVENPAPMVVKDSMLAEWLKSLKERIQPQNTWKPSDEQMQALCSKLPLLTGSGNEVQRVLETLYCDLKKLRNE